MYNSAQEGKVFIQEYLTNKRLNNFLNREEDRSIIQARIEENEEWISSFQKES